MNGTNERNALCSPPINNGVDAVTKDVAVGFSCWWAVAAAAAGDCVLLPVMLFLVLL